VAAFSLYKNLDHKVKMNLPTVSFFVIGCGDDLRWETELARFIMLAAMDKYHSYSTQTFGTKHNPTAKLR